ncbi:hypothetical protein [Desulfomarina sp.]
MSLVIQHREGISNGQPIMRLVNHKTLSGQVVILGEHPGTVHLKIYGQRVYRLNRDFHQSAAVEPWSQVMAVYGANSFYGGSG